MGEEGFNNWQNNVMRGAFLLSCIASLIIFIFVVLVFFNVGTGVPGDTATPVVLLCLIGLLIFMVGAAIERESIKSRLPKVTKVMLGIIFFTTVLTFSLKSFPFGLGIMTTIILSVFLQKNFEFRLRCIACCSSLICMTLAEAQRQAGGYDSGGVARYVINAYAFGSVYFPALIIIATIRLRPFVVKMGCFGFGLLTIHSAAVMCAGMSDVLDNTFSGRGQGLEHQYCIEDNIPSPLGFVVETFQDFIFPRYVLTSTITTTPPPPTSPTTTTTPDCNLLLLNSGNNSLDVTSEVWDNSSNGSGWSRQTTNILDGLDFTHCIEFVAVALPAAFDPNSTTTTSTTTTSTSLTTTSLTTITTTTTIVTTTSTTTTSTSTTSTTSTSTTSTTTSTTTTTFTTTDPNATTTTTAVRNTTVPIIEFYLAPVGQYCPKYQDVTTVTECQLAALQLHLIYGNVFTGPGEHKLCHFAGDGRGKVFFNQGNPPSPRAWPEMFSICHKEVPSHFVFDCVPGTPDTEIRENGYWALAIFGLAGLWFSALNFVIILLAPEQKVHPDEIPEEEPGAHLEAWVPEPGKRRQSQIIRARQSIHDNSKKGWLAAKKLCKKACAFLLHSVETMIGTAVFGCSAIALWVTAIVQLPLEKPECARDPRSASSLFAWAEEPAFAFKVVWCDMGSLASVCIAFLSFSCFLLNFSMSLIKVQKLQSEAYKRKVKRDLKRKARQAKEDPESVLYVEGPILGPGFRVQKMIPPEEKPPPLYEDYDGMVYEC